jgi:adenosylhomocysteine nucleosidase
MLIWVCALHCEAKPVIDFYRLKKSHDDNAFDLYRGDGMLCIISGTGKIASATACAWVAAKYQQEASIAWINLGTAGSAQQEIGAAFLLNQIIDADSGQRHYPAPCAGSILPGYACLTLSQASDNYRQDYLFDMEASGFMYSSLRFSSAELTQCIKIVSDNEIRQTGKNRQQVSDLIHRNIESIDRLANALTELNNEIAGLAIPDDSWRQLTSLAHFSQTQKNRLRVLWRYLVNRDPGSSKLLLKLQSCSSSADIIKTLEQLSHQDSEEL